jgi:Zinc knuckle
MTTAQALKDIQEALDATRTELETLRTAVTARDEELSKMRRRFATASASGTAARTALGGQDDDGDGWTAMDWDNSPAPRGPPQRPLSIRIPDGFHNDPTRKDENWLTFKKSYETYCVLQGLNDEQKKGVLYCAMKGPAAEAVVNIDIKDYTPTELMAVFEKKFMPAAASTLAQTNFEQATMRTGESALSWHSRLFSLWKRAYPTMTDETLLIRRFAMGNPNTDTRRELLRKSPKDYDEALNIAQTEEAVNKATKNTAINQTIMPAPAMVEADEDDPTAIDAMGGPVKCYQCGQLGHIKRECTNAARPAEKAYPAKTGGSSRGSSASRGNSSGWKRGGRGGKGRTAQPRNRQDRRRRFRKMINAFGEVMAELTDGEDDESGEEGEEGDDPEDTGEDPNGSAACAAGN